MITDLTEGNIRKLLWSFSIPMLISVAFQQMYNIADSVIAGRFIGEDALAAVGASYPITMIFMAIAIGSSSGCAVIISRLFGGRQYLHLKCAVSTICITTLVLSVVLTIFGVWQGEAMLRMLQTPENIFADGALYLKIYIYGFLFLFLYNVCTGIFTALGDSRTPLYLLIGSSLGNIVLDLIFVIPLDMGVAGVAWATFVAQGISSILAFFLLLLRLHQIVTTKPFPLFSFHLLGQISVIAIPSILQQSFVSVGNLFIQSLVNSFGSAVIAGYSSAIKLNTFAVTCMMTLANGLSSFTAQNIGAHKESRLSEGLKESIRMGVLVCLPFVLIYIFLGRFAIGLFMDSESQQAIGTGMLFLKIVSPFYFVVMIKAMCDGVLRGTSSIAYFTTTTFTDLVLRVVLAYWFVKGFHMDSMGIWLSWPVGWSVSTLLSVIFYRMRPWRKHGPNPRRRHKATA